jgi:hypothetical protein
MGILECEAKCWWGNVHEARLLHSLSCVPPLFSELSRCMWGINSFCLPTGKGYNAIKYLEFTVSLQFFLALHVIHCPFPHPQDSLAPMLWKRETLCDSDLSIGNKSQHVVWSPSASCKWPCHQPMLSKWKSSVLHSHHLLCLFSWVWEL